MYIPYERRPKYATGAYASTRVAADDRVAIAQITAAEPNATMSAPPVE
jgi:hypothetical protein